MAEPLEPVKSGDIIPIADSADKMVKNLSRGRQIGPLESPFDGYSFVNTIKPVVHVAKLTPERLFNLEDRKSLAERGFAIVSLDLTHGRDAANLTLPLKFGYAGFEGDLDQPRITEVAFHIAVSTFDVPENTGRPLKEQRAFIRKYGEEIADEIGARGRIAAVIGHASEVHQALGRYLQTHGLLPVDRPDFPHLRTETEAGGGLGVVLKIAPGGKELIPSPAMKHSGEWVNSVKDRITAWPFLMPTAVL